MSRAILEVLAGRKPARRPAWFMRQAGRCLPEYRELRKKHGFLDLLRDAEIGCEVTMMPMRRFDFDAAILFTDLLVPLEAMGVPLEYTPGPELGWTVNSREDLERLEDFDTANGLAVPLQTARLVRAELEDERSLLGFVGAPWTLAAYLVEGKGSKTWNQLRTLAWSDPEFFDAMLAKLVDACIDFGVELHKAGCDAVQIFDSWAGVAEPGLFRQRVLPALRRLVDGLHAAGVPTIYFLNGAAPLLDIMVDTGANALGLDWRVDLGHACEAIPQGLAVQGNLDPAALFADAATIESEVRRICAAAGDRPHVFNVGHGLDPTTPIEGIEAALRALRAVDAEG